MHFLYQKSFPTEVISKEHLAWRCYVGCLRSAKPPKRISNRLPFYLTITSFERPTLSSSVGELG
jgi:hypothetical protein